MRFVLSIDLDNAEVADAGVEVALPEYLRNVADKFSADPVMSGRVWDGNGNAIGHWSVD